MPFGSIDVTLAFSCGLDAIFDAIGFGGGVVVVVDDAGVGLAVAGTVLAA
jgi:hypothetical protein